MQVNVTKFGDWGKAQKVLQKSSVNIYPAFEAQLQEDGELLLKTYINHIESQDLNWTPLSQRTIELKGGDSTIYVETGYLKENLQVVRVKIPKKVSVFIGASSQKTTPDGIKFSDLMMWLEYGTDKIPPRPLIRPSWEEVEPIIKNNWRELLQSIIQTGDS